MGAPGKEGGEPPAVLLVDAAPSLRTVTRLHLGAGLEVVEAADEQSAFELLRARRIDLAICAADGPRVEGLACLRRLRAEPCPRVRALPVLLLSEAAAPELRALVAGLGPAAVLEGPATAPRLSAAVAELLGAAVSA
jgi:two-component system chemotaxis response regulator CheY